MYFADQFEETAITDIDVRETVQVLKAKLGLTPLYQPQTAILTPVSNTLEPFLPGLGLAPGSVVHVDVGDVVMLPLEREGSWRSVKHYWYAYVQRMRVTKDGRTRLDVIWLYHASDTTIRNVYYPFLNELFFSDNCGCDTRDHQES